MLGVRISEEMEQKLVHFAQVSKRTKSSLVKEALNKFFEDMEDYYRALERLEQHKNSGRQATSWEDVQRELGLLDDKE